LHVAILVVILVVELLHCRRARFYQLPLEHSPAGRFHLCIHIDDDTGGLWHRHTKREDRTAQHTVNWSHRLLSLTRPHTPDKAFRCFYASRRRLLWRLDSPESPAPHLFMPKAIDDVVIDHSDSLHK